MSFLKSVFGPKEPVERRRSVRRPAPGCEIGHFCGDGVRVNAIRDISAMGVYLLTEDRWIPGSRLPLTLHSTNEFPSDSKRHVTLHAKAVRCDEDGVGFSFVPPSDVDADSWVDLMESSVNEQAPDDIVGQFRMAEAIAFLGQIAPSTVGGVRQLIRGELNNQHVANVVEIALKTKGMVSGWEDVDALRVHEHVVLHVLEHGSWADEEETQRFWAGLLAASCMRDGADESNLFFVDLFSHLAPIHIRIFAAACERATTVLGTNGELSAEPLELSPAEIMRISHSRDLVRIERDLFHLSELGLIEGSEKSKTMTVIERAGVTPTRLGLELYARCHAHREAVPDFYAAGHPAAHAV
ncbi:MAG TPA: PilZ domain-containing protein [Terracidiphilus sp.]|nr:PilZ domain-containing protein [Terracidiphilus sp.]